MKETQTNTKYTSTFYMDLQEANDLENKLAKEFELNWNCTATTFQGIGSFPDYDLQVQLKDKNISLTIEVKQDKMSQKTGNIAVEYERTMKDGTVKPTCISISKSDLYAYYFDNEFWLIDTEDLRKMIANKLYFKTISGAGDGHRASCYLFRKDVCKKHFTSFKKLKN